MDFDVQALCRSRRAMLLSPHLDDGVFSCGELLSGLDEPMVVTVFAGMPAAGAALTPWDGACGFTGAAQAVGRRWQEDEEALHMLGAEPVRLGFLDSQYGVEANPGHLSAALQELMSARQPEVVLLPMGLFHSDHALVHEAALACMEAMPAPVWIAYEDALYRRKPGLLQRRLATLRERRLRATPLAVRERAQERKRAAVQAYGSQLRAFGPGGYADTEMPEGYWLLEAHEESADEA